jgi:hypothetical protein
MLQSLPALESRAKTLIYSYDSYRTGNLPSLTDTRNGPRTAGEIRNVRSNVKAFAFEARAIIADRAFASLDAAIQADVTAIAEEMETAQGEIDTHAHHDKVFSTLTPEQRDDVTQRVSLPTDAVALIAARVAGKLRDQRPPKPTRSESSPYPPTT